MFYVKEKINDAVEVSIDISDKNVFCICPGCGGEVCVDLADMLPNEDFDLYGTSVYFDDCSAIRRVGGRGHAR